jgi:hypothetical protein
MWVLTGSNYRHNRVAYFGRSNTSGYIALANGTTAPSHMRVPLPDGTSAPIPTLRNEDASFMLGIGVGPASGGTTHVREMARKGYNWVDRMKSRPLPHDLAWRSFIHQLQPGIMWGITTVVMSPLKLLEQFQRVYFRCLPSLNVNQHINLPWRLIPERYQGLGLPNYALISLASKLSLIQRGWGFNDVNRKSNHDWLRILYDGGGVVRKHNGP